MNSLSWMIYLIDVAGNAKVAATVLTIIIGLCCGIYTLFFVLEEGELRFVRTRWFVTFGALLFVLVLIPNRGSMYAIAASEVGERIAQTPTAQELSGDALKAVRAWIKSQIKDSEK